MVYESYVEERSFPHEIHVLYRKIVYGYKWRHKDTFDNKIRRQCRTIVETRIVMANEDLRKLAIENKRSLRMLDKLTDKLKLRTTLVTFRTNVHLIERYTREMIIERQRQNFHKRLQGMSKKENIRKTHTSRGVRNR